MRCPAAGTLTATTLAVLAMATGLGACDRAPTGPVPAAPHVESRGVAVGDWTASGVASAEGRAALDGIAATGANAVVFIVTTWQDTAGSSAFTTQPPRPDFAAFQTAAGWAHERSLDVYLKIHVDVSDGTWRGAIDPVDVDGWFRSYVEFVRGCAQAATDADAAGLVVGTELAGLVRHEAAWRHVIDTARDLFGGQVLYAASWDEVGRVPFWDAVDFIGVDAYFPVADRPGPGRFEILAAWQPWLARLDAVRRRVGRDVFITEIGYCSYAGAGMTPHVWDADRPVDLNEQADLYWAALSVFADAPWIRGVHWWNWTLRDAGGDANDGYTPRGKPAERVLTEAWGGGGAP